MIFLNEELICIKCFENDLLRSGQPVAKKSGSNFFSAKLALNAHQASQTLPKVKSNESFLCEMLDKEKKWVFVYYLFFKASKVFDIFSGQRTV